jgi:hypothetical protein
MTSETCRSARILVSFSSAFCLLSARRILSEKNSCQPGLTGNPLSIRTDKVMGFEVSTEAAQTPAATLLKSSSVELYSSPMKS